MFRCQFYLCMLWKVQSYRRYLQQKANLPLLLRLLKRLKEIKGAEVPFENVIQLVAKCISTLLEFGVRIYRGRSELSKAPLVLRKKLA